jgi:hypothetical protein
MAPTLQLPQEAARIWGDPDKRAQIIAMHEADTPLVKMCEDLGLRSMLDADNLRTVLEQLTPDEVAAIRAAFVAEAAATPGPGASFPVNCVVGNLRDGVRVLAENAAPGATGPIARVESA